MILHLAFIYQATILCQDLLNPHLISSGDLCTHTAAGSDCDLDCIPSWLAYVFQVQGFVGGLIVATLYGEWCGINADLD